MPVSPHVQMRRVRRRAMGGTFMVAVALAVQLGQQGALADDNLILTGPVAFFGALLSGLQLRASAGIAMAGGIVSALWALGVAQTGSPHTDEVLLFGIPFAAAAAIVVGHCRDWHGRTAGLMALVLAALMAGVGLTDFPEIFAVAVCAITVSLPTVPLR